MIIEISPKKILKDAVTVWNNPGSEIDLTMEVNKLTFRENSIDAIYTYHVLDHLFSDEIIEAISNWKKCLKPGGNLFIVVDDFEYVCREFVGGDINIDQFNKNHTRPCNFNKDNIVEYCMKAGFPEGSVKIWFTDIPNIYIKKHYEMIFSAQK